MLSPSGARVTLPLPESTAHQLSHFAAKSVTVSLSVCGPGLWEGEAGGVLMGGPSEDETALYHFYPPQNPRGHHAGGPGGEMRLMLLFLSPSLFLSDRGLVGRWSLGQMNMSGGRWW